MERKGFQIKYNNIIATNKILSSNSILESSKASNPHSYADNFSGSGFEGDVKKLAMMKLMLKKKSL